MSGITRQARCASCGAAGSGSSKAGCALLAFARPRTRLTFRQRPGLADRLPEHAQRAQRSARLGARSDKVVHRQLPRRLDPLPVVAPRLVTLRACACLSTALDSLATDPSLVGAGDATAALCPGAREPRPVQPRRAQPHLALRERVPLCASLSPFLLCPSWSTRTATRHRLCSRASLVTRRSCGRLQSRSR